MKTKQFIIFSFLIVLSTNVQAQFKIDSTVWKKSKIARKIKDTLIINSHEEGQVVYRTKAFMITKPEMFTSQFFMSFSKDKGVYSFWLKYGTEISDIETDSIKSVLFIFTDASKLEFPKQKNSKTFVAPWTLYFFYTTISLEEIELFSKKRLLAVQLNVAGDKRHHNSTIPNNRSIKLAQMTHYFLTKEKLYEEDILKRFAENQYKEKYLNEKWNY